MPWAAVMRTRRALLGALVTCLGLAALPAAAAAATRCVGTSGSGCDAVYSAIGDDAEAGSAVNAAVAGDTIRIGPGSYTEAVSTAKNLSFVGAGSGTLDSFDAASQTRIVGPSGMGGMPALVLKGGGSVASIQAVGGNATSLELAGNGLTLEAPGTGGALDYSVSEVVAIGGTGGYGSTALLAFDLGRAINATVSGGAVGNTNFGTGAVVSSPNSSSSLTGVIVRASTGNGVSSGEGTLRIVRSRVVARTPLLVNGRDSGARTEAIDSVFMTPAGDGDEPAGYVYTLGAGNSSLSARGSTFLARGSGASAGIRLLKSTIYSGALSADLRNTIARTESIDPQANDLVADSGGTITADFSNFTTRHYANGGTSPSPLSASNVVGDPKFTNPAGEDLTLQAGSPLIDRGDPAIVTPGELDAAGNARSLDGDGDCTARPDIGAFERPDACPPGGPPPNATPSVSGFSMSNTVFAPKGGPSAAARPKPKRGTTFRYTLSEAARVTITIERALPGRRARVRGRTRCLKPTRRNRRARKCGRYRRSGALSGQEQPGSQSTPFSGRLRGKPLRPGRYRARIVAVDSLGARSSERRLSFRVVRP